MKKAAGSSPPPFFIPFLVRRADGD